MQETFFESNTKHLVRFPAEFLCFSSTAVCKRKHGKAAGGLCILIRQCQIQETSNATSTCSVINLIKGSGLAKPKKRKRNIANQTEVLEEANETEVPEEVYFAGRKYQSGLRCSFWFRYSIKMFLLVDVIRICDFFFNLNQRMTCGETLRGEAC